MKRYRLTIAGSIGLVSLAALGLAALRLADDRWASSVYSLAIFATLTAILGAAFARGPRQAFCAGFATFCGAYLLLCFGPWASDVAETYPIAFPTASEPLMDAIDVSGYDRPTLVTESWLESLFNLQNKRSNDFSLGSKVHTLWRGSFYPSTVIEVGDGSFKVHYDNYDAMSDEWVEASRLRRRDTNHGPFLQVGHALFSLLFGVIGGVIAVLFRRSRRSEPVQLIAGSPSS